MIWSNPLTAPVGQNLSEPDISTLTKNIVSGGGHRTMTKTMQLQNEDRNTNNNLKSKNIYRIKWSREERIPGKCKKWKYKSIRDAEQISDVDWVMVVTCPRLAQTESYVFIPRLSRRPPYPAQFFMHPTFHALSCIPSQIFHAHLG